MSYKLRMPDPAHPLPRDLEATEIVCRDVRATFIEVRCWPVEDDDAVASISVRDAEDGIGIAAWLSEDDARKLARVLSVLGGESEDVKQ